MAFFVSDDVGVGVYSTKSAQPGMAVPQGLGMESVGEPVAAVGDPPAEGEDGEGGDDGPDKGESEVGDEAEGGEEEPEDFALHGESLAQMLGAKSTVRSDCATSAKRDLKPRPARGRRRHRGKSEEVAEQRKARDGGR